MAARQRWGEIGAAWVVLAPETACDATELIELCKSRLAKYKQPRHVFFLTADELPTTPTGKVQKFMLIKQGIRALGIA